jgi:plasmid stability protein
MAQILVRNLDERVKARLQRRAKRNGRSMEEEAREILRDALRQKNAPEVGFGTQMANMFRGVGLKKSEEIKEIRGMRLQVPKF